MKDVSGNVAAFVLAGGQSTRMGTDKAFVMLRGRTLLESALELARSVTENVTVVGDRAKFSAFAPVVEDAFPGCGPLSGIHAALRKSEHNLNLILAVDLPFASPELLNFLVTRARSAPGCSVTVPRTAQGWQPLCAVYCREFADAAEKALREGQYRIDRLFDPVRTREVTEVELQAAGFSTLAFRNLNTPADLEEASEQFRPRAPAATKQAI